MDELSAVRQQFYEVIADVEFSFSKVAVYPATIPIFEFKGRERFEFVERRGRRVKMRSPVGYLHFDGEHLSFSQVAMPYRGSQQPDRHCPVCRTICHRCRELRNLARTRWNERETAKTKPMEVLEIEDGGTLSAICGALPAMHKRLVQDSKVTPEEIAEAIQSVEAFIASIKKA